MSKAQAKVTRKTNKIHELTRENEIGRLVTES